MNILASILTVATLGFGASSVYLYSELDAARSEAGLRTAPCRDEQAQIAVLQRACVELDAIRGEGPPAGDSADDSVEPAIGRLQPDMRESPLDAHELRGARPEREFSRARHEGALRRLYGGIGKELSLPPDQEAELLALLLRHQAEQIETARRFAGDRAAMTSAMNDLRRENDTELMAALGDKYLQFEDYQKTLGERMQIEQAALQLEAASIPLREKQRTDLLDVMVDERDRVPRPGWSPGVPAREYLAQQRAWQEDYEARVRDRAASVLTSDQLKQYDVYRNLQLAMRRSRRNGSGSR